MTSRQGSLLALVLVLLFGAGCFGGSDDSATPARSSQDFIVGRPQGRTAIGDVDRAIRRFENTRADLIGLFRAQPWFQDGLDAQESLFAERAITFAGGQQASSFQSLNQASIRDKLFLHERVTMRTREIDLVLIYEPGDDGPRQFALLKAILPVLEGELNVEFPESAITVVNGNFPINDYITAASSASRDAATCRPLWSRMSWPTRTGLRGLSGSTKVWPTSTPRWSCSDSTNSRRKAGEASTATSNLFTPAASERWHPGASRTCRYRAGSAATDFTKLPTCFC
jgi:hypothetical protein